MVSCQAQGNRPLSRAMLLSVRSADAEPTVEALFDAAVEPFSGDPRVTGGTGFGSSPARRVDGRIFAMLVRGALVVKLPRRRVDELVETGKATWFDAGKGRPMREWASISPTQADAWDELVAEAHEFVGSIGPTRTSRRGSTLSSRS
jgi:hypothetical protein